MRIAILFMLILATLSFAEDYVAINSVDGRDVLSGVYYANVKGLPVKFMASPGGDPDIFAIKVGSDHDILLIQGTLPVSGLVESSLRANNNSIELYASADGLETNLDLATRSGADRFIIVDSAYADSALSVLPYAALSGSYVILTDKDNIEDVKDVVAGKDVAIYGYVDQDVKDELSSLDPEIIGTGEDKFQDNILIAGKAMDEFGAQTLVMADGTFIEDGMATAKMPILLIGRIIPTVTYDFVKEQLREDNIKEIQLVGYDYVQPAYDMRERIEQDLLPEGLNKTFALTVKFAQIVPSAGSSPLQLDKVALPTYKPSLNISEVVYNSDSKNIMITVDNLGEGVAYYNLEALVKVNGADFGVYTNPDVKQIERGDSQGTEFALDLSSVPEGDVTVTVTVRYGSFRSSLEDFAYYSGSLTTISFVDESDVGVQHAKYDREQKTLLVTMKNNGNETAYVSSKVSLLIDGALTNVSSPAVREIEASSLFVEEFPLELSEEDIAANKEATVFLRYGARKGFLNKEGEFTVPLEEAGFPLIFVGAFIAVLLIAAYLLFGRKGMGKK